MKSTELSAKQLNILRTYAARAAKLGKIEKIISILLIAVIFWGLYGFYMQLAHGHGVTGMRDNIVWGYYISDFIYFIGVSYGCALLAALMHFFKIEWGKPIIRISALVAFICGIIGPIYILLCIGRFERLHYLFIYARVQSPITWDVMVISTYLIGITLFLYLLLIKDIAILAKTDEIIKPGWKQKLYNILSLGYTGNKAQEELINKSSRSVSFVIIPKVILAFSVLSWIFGMTLRPGWHSTIFGPSFIISSIATSIALVILVMWFYRRWYNISQFITDRQFNNLGILLLILISVYGYFTFSEYITVWYSSGKWETAVMEKLFSFHEFGWSFHLSNFMAIVLPFFLLLFKKFRKHDPLMVIALIIVVSMWVKRYLTVVPTLETTLLPIQDTRPEYLEYTATWVEWSLVFTGASTFIVFCILAPKFINLIPISENK